MFAKYACIWMTVGWYWLGANTNRGEGVKNNTIVFSKSVFKVILFNFKRVASGPVMLAHLKQYTSR